jgi:hypothetical protein
MMSRLMMPSASTITTRSVVERRKPSATWPVAFAIVALVVVVTVVPSAVTRSHVKAES